MLLVRIPFGIGLIVAAGLIVTRAVLRDTNHGDPAGLTAFTAYIFTWGTWLGMGNLFRRGKHISGISLLERAGAPGRAAACVVNICAAAVFGVLCFWQGLDLVGYQLRSHVPSEGALDWPRFTLTAAAPIGSLLLLIAVLFMAAGAGPRVDAPERDRIP